MAIRPSEYAQRFRPVTVIVPGLPEPYVVHVDRYHIGNPTPAKDALWGAVGTHFAQKQKPDKAYRLELMVDRSPVSVASREEIRWPIINPFWGKGSPEECQINLQLAVRLGVTAPERLQQWANDNIGLDCNGYAGNYLFRILMKKDWRAIADGRTEPGPKNDIDTIFNWVLKQGKAVEKTDDIDPELVHVFVRVDDQGKVMPGGPKSMELGQVGHIGLTEPGRVMKQSFVTDSMVYDLAAAQRGLYGHFALGTWEAAGDHYGGIKRGVDSNWLVFQEAVKGQPGVFKVTRDRINKIDRIRIAALPKSLTG